MCSYLKYSVKRWVFKAVLNREKEGLWRIEYGREFQTLGADTEKERWPCCFRRKRGGRKSLVSFEERRVLEGVYMCLSFKSLRCRMWILLMEIGKVEGVKG